MNSDTWNGTYDIMQSMLDITEQKPPKKFKTKKSWKQQKPKNV